MLAISYPSGSEKFQGPGPVPGAVGAGRPFPAWSASRKIALSPSFSRFVNPSAGAGTLASDAFLLLKMNLENRARGDCLREGRKVLCSERQYFDGSLLLGWKKQPHLPVTGGLEQWHTACKNSLPYSWQHAGEAGSDPIRTKHGAQ